MLSKNVLCCSDKRTPIIFHLLSQLRSSRTSSHVVKQPYPLVGSQNSFTNLLNGILEKQMLFTPHSEVKQYLKDNAGHYRSTFTTLMDIFHIDRKTARSIIAKNQMLDDVPKKRLIHNYNKLKDAGLSSQLIQNNVILLMEDPNTLDKKLENTKKIVKDVNDGVCFLHCSIKSLDFYIERSTKRFASAFNEVEFFQEQLKCDTRQVNQLISKYLNFVTHHPNYTLRKLKLLLDYKISVHSLIQNDWPIYFTYARLKTRLESCAKAGLLMPIESSILSCDNKNFNKLIATHSVKKDNVCESSGIIDFLSEKSGYDKTLIQDRIPQEVLDCLSNMEEFTEKIAIFLKEGYEYHDIIWSCKVLALPKSLIVQRLSTFKKLNHRPPSLSILLWPKGLFYRHVNNVKGLVNKSR